jgi:SAM-dependent methyltransferase
MLVDMLVRPNTRWLDVGGGKTVFPDDPRWAAELASRCRHLVAVDPSETVLQNSLAHRGVQCMIEDYRTAEVFDLATLRMVAEHVEQPARVMSALRTLVAPGGFVVVLTPNRWSPGSIIAAIVPDSLHPLFTRWLSGRKEEDTFPTLYLLNTRRALRHAFEQSGFREHAFWSLSDLSLLQRYGPLLLLQLITWRALAWMGIGYPENVLLGLYERVDGR